MLTNLAVIFPTDFPSAVLASPCVFLSFPPHQAPKQCHHNSFNTKCKQKSSSTFLSCWEPNSRKTERTFPLLIFNPEIMKLSIKHALFICTNLKLKLFPANIGPLQRPHAWSHIFLLNILAVKEALFDHICH